ncbi:translation initiation factor IF-2 [Bartonella sp. WD12.1]|nr:translation initiation factor IF-2 [Bartonella sp. WD12.1]
MKQQDTQHTAVQTQTFSPAVSLTEPIESAKAATPFKNTASIEKRAIDDNEDEEKRNRRANLSKSEIRAPKAVKGADERRPENSHLIVP